MDSINRNKAKQRIGYVYDTYVSAQADGKAVKKHVKTLTDMTGETPEVDTNEFVKDFGSI